MNPGRLELTFRGRSKTPSLQNEQINNNIEAKKKSSIEPFADYIYTLTYSSCRQHTTRMQANHLLFALPASAQRLMGFEKAYRSAIGRYRFVLRHGPVSSSSSSSSSASNKIASGGGRVLRDRVDEEEEEEAEEPALLSLSCTSCWAAASSVAVKRSLGGGATACAPSESSRRWSERAGLAIISSARAISRPRSCIISFLGKQATDLGRLVASRCDVPIISLGIDAYPSRLPSLLRLRKEEERTRGGLLCSLPSGLYLRTCNSALGPKKEKRASRKQTPRSFPNLPLNPFILFFALWYFRTKPLQVFAVLSHSVSLFAAIARPRPFIPNRKGESSSCHGRNVAAIAAEADTMTGEGESMVVNPTANAMEVGGIMSQEAMTGTALEVLVGEIHTCGRLCLGSLRRRLQCVIDDKIRRRDGWVPPNRNQYDLASGPQSPAIPDDDSVVALSHALALEGSSSQHGTTLADNESLGNKSAAGSSNNQMQDGD
ncbi:hypothetical protein BHM03_00042366 [Ensete ventricosum]|uniref:Uncharacterized protein n=1 Tax=Ensete ventricosum TaxID=4639 RepID=A0A445MKK8_ENSVE|nr:hypothetical protein BHM03_00042366 [Ensete ventricosum]